MAPPTKSGGGESPTGSFSKAPELGVGAWPAAKIPVTVSFSVGKVGGTPMKLRAERRNRRGSKPVPRFPQRESGSPRPVSFCLAELRPGLRNKIPQKLSFGRRSRRPFGEPSARTEEFSQEKGAVSEEKSPSAEKNRAGRVCSIEQ